MALSAQFEHFNVVQTSLMMAVVALNGMMVFLPGVMRMASQRMKLLWE